jgi:outer membrane receptor protein involved in Fe transport
VRDNQDIYELQNYFAAAEGNHSLNFGARLRAYRDADFTNGGTNGQYTFQSLTEYADQDPSDVSGDRGESIHRARDPVRCRAFLPGRLEGKQRFTFSYGLRWETQNRVRDKSDWAPRLSFAYALGGTAMRSGRPRLFCVRAMAGSTSGSPCPIASAPTRARHT